MTTETQGEVLELERAGWQALSEGAAAARTFYEAVLHDDVAMLFPGGMAVRGRENVLEAMGGEPWEAFELTDEDVTTAAADTAVVTYRARANRAGQPPYEALIGSVYVRDATGWRLVLHQQTPA